MRADQLVSDKAAKLKGQMRWKIFSGALTAQVVIGFLKWLTRHERRKLFLISDNLRVDHSQLVKQLLQAMPTIM